MSHFQSSPVQSSINPDPDLLLPGLDEGEIIVIRSKRRKRTISAYRQGGRIVVSIPARLTKAQERSAVPEMVAKIRAQEEAKTVDESALASRIDELLTSFAPEITERPASVTWRTMRERWGSCTNIDATIRISSRLQTMVRLSRRPCLVIPRRSKPRPTSMGTKQPNPTSRRPICPDSSPDPRWITPPCNLRHAQKTLLSLAHKAPFRLVCG